MSGARPCTTNAWEYPLAQDACFSSVPMWYGSRRGDCGASARVEVQLVVSRDGIRWERPWRVPPMSPEAPSLRGSGRVSLLQDAIIRDDGIWLYYRSQPTSYLGPRTKPSCVPPERVHLHAEPRPNPDVFGRAIGRLDRLVAAEADPDGGLIVTPPIRLRGSTL